MARPPKNNCDYFTHDAGMRNHVKVKALRQKFQNGYAIWSMLLEFLTASDGNVFENTEIQYELLSGDFCVSVTEIRDVVNYCLKLEMLFDKDGWIYSESLNDRLAPVYEKRGRAKELSKKQLRNNGKYASSNTDATVVSVTEMPQSKVNEIKVNKRVFIPPTVEMVISYFKENGYTEHSAVKAFNFYHVAGWVDSKGKKVLNWKQKMNGVWFKDENKEKIDEPKKMVW